MNNIEILAPAGSTEAFYSAIHHGADAVYLAGKSFGARASAANFTNEEIKQLVDYAHLMGVKVYVTVNTLIKDHEFDEAVDFVRFLYHNHCDAVIVQDLGLLDVIRQLFPDLDVHVSTQMNVHSYEQALFLKQIGVKRIVLAREISLDTIKKIATIAGLELEVFVHGALCMSYSGNCYLSSILGGRSGNRGRCAQPCRLEYSLSSDINNEYYLSTKDLMTLEYLDDIIQAGVHSLKIEGRLKRPEYVGLAVRSYKRALEKKLEGNEQVDLAHMFNRLFTRGFINSESNTLFSNTLSPNHLGVVCGKVIQSKNRNTYIKLTDSLNNKDSIRFVSKQEDAITINNNMYLGEKVVASAKKEDVICIRTHHPVDVGSVVLRTTNSKLIESIQDVPEKKIPIKGIVFLENQKLVFEISDGVRSVKMMSQADVLPSTNPDFTLRLRDQLLKMNQTPFIMESLEVYVDGVFLAIKDINEIRRKAVEGLIQERIKREARQECKLEQLDFEIKETRSLFFKASTQEQLDACLDQGVDHILVENRHLKDVQHHQVSVVSSRIQSMGSKEAKGSLGSLDNALFSSAYLNVANARAVYFLHRLGVKHVCLSIELSKNEIKSLVQSYQQLYGKSPNVAIMAYGYYELMIMKHCLINKALGLEKKGCARCREEQFYLKDSNQVYYPLLDDGKCNLRLFSSLPVHLLSYLDELEASGVTNFLVDLTIDKNYLDVILLYNTYFKNKMITGKLEKTMTGHIEEGVR